MPRPAAALPPPRVEQRTLFIWAGIAALLVLTAGMSVWLSAPEPPPPARPDAAAEAQRESTPITVGDGPAVAMASFVESSLTQPIVLPSAGTPEEMVTQLRAAVGRNPADPEALTRLALGLIQVGQHPEGILYLQRVVAATPQSWSAHFNLARAYSQTENWARASPAYEAALALAPGDYATVYDLAVALLRQGRAEEAVTRFEEAMALQPVAAAPHLGLGMSRERMTQLREAADAYRRYLELAGGDVVGIEEIRAQIDALMAAAAQAEALPPAPDAPAPAP